MDLFEDFARVTDFADLLDSNELFNETVIPSCQPSTITMDAQTLYGFEGEVKSESQDGDHEHEGHFELPDELSLDIQQLLATTQNDHITHNTNDLFPELQPTVEVDETVGIEHMPFQSTSSNLVGHTAGEAASNPEASLLYEQQATANANETLLGFDQSQLNLKEE